MINLLLICIFALIIFSIITKVATGYFYIGIRLKLRAFLYKYIDKNISFDFQDMIYDLLNGLPPVCHYTIGRVLVYDNKHGIYKPLRDITYKIDDSIKTTSDWLAINLNNNKRELIFNSKRMLINFKINDRLYIIKCDKRNFLKMLEYIYKRFSDIENIDFIDEFKKDVELRKSILS